MNPTQLDADRTPVWHSTPAAAREPGHFGPGLAIGRYRLERVLGEGTYGQVHLAKQDMLGRKVAVKILHRRHGSKSQEIRAFVHEALILADLNHPGIVPVYDAGWEVDGFFYIVSRFVEGGDLSRLLAGSRPVPEEAAQIALAIAEALHYAHTRGLVHRDIKPANILIDAPKKPLLTDFGVALRDKDFGRGSKLVGTPAYMSPEQAGGKGDRVDGRSDIFSLGIVLYELLTGVRPFRGETQRELLDQVRRAEVRSPCEVDDQIPDALGRICLKALARRASERYPTAEEMASALRDCLQALSGNRTHIGVAVSSETTQDSSDGLSTGAIPQTSTNSDQTIAGYPEVRITPRGLCPYEAPDAPFFLEMLPGPRGAGGLPECVEFWKSRIEGQGGEESFPVGLLFGPSGCGKTSLIRAGLLPVLSDRISLVHVEATADGTEATFLKALQQRFPGRSEGLGLASWLTATRKGQTLPPGKKLLVIIDQFERWLRVGRIGEEKGLVDALRQCDGEHLQALIVVRDDSWSSASRLMRELGDRIVEGGNSAAVDPFDRRHARKILTAFGRAYGTLPEGQPLSDDQENFLDGVLSVLDEGDQILPVRLALFAELAKGWTWDEQSLTEFLRMGDVATAFVEEAFNSRSAPAEVRQHLKAARSVLGSLLPLPGRHCDGRGRTYGDLLSASGYASQPVRFESLMRILTDELGLVSQASIGTLGASSDDSTGREHCYRLSHDYMIAPIRGWLSGEGATKRDCISVPLPEPDIPERVKRINVNAATEEELTTLPGVSAAIARRLIEARPLSAMADLLKVKGIGEKTLRRIELHIDFG
jgi:serine/threonine protein kinase